MMLEPYVAHFRSQQWQAILTLLSEYSKYRRNRIHHDKLEFIGHLSQFLYDKIAGELQGTSMKV